MFQANTSIGMRENPELEKIGKKFKRSKKKETSVTEEMTDHAAVENAMLENLELPLVEDENDVYSQKSSNGKKIEICTLGKGVEKCEEGDISNAKNEGERKRRKNKSKRMGKEEDKNTEEKKHPTRGEDTENRLTANDEVAEEKVKTKKRKNKNLTDKDGHIVEEINTEATNSEKRKRRKTNSVENDPRNPNPKEKKKTVRFSGQVEVFPSSDKINKINSGNEEYPKDGIVQGKRFTREEDEILKAAISKYVESHCLGDKGIEMVMNCKYHSKVKNCWKEISTALPHRPYTAVYYRAHTLYENRRKWTKEEIEKLREYQTQHGNNWKAIAEEFGRNRVHVKDTWRRVKADRNRGHWSQDEYQKLFNLVNVDLRMKAFEERKSKHGMLRDNISWCAISDRLSTRSDSTCCAKWYQQLTSSLVAEGIWADSDDYRLLDTLFYLDASCIEDVDWDNLIEHRCGDVCRRRWDQMVLHIGLHGNKSFTEQVEVLSKRYCPDLLEAREAWESKPLVP